MSTDRAALTADLLRRYDRPGPRYTSYPTAVEFHAGFTAADYAECLTRAAADPDSPLSLYLHLPFCEERCTFCGCMVIITKKREVAAKYLTYLARELEMVASALGRRRHVVQYHWGGGTPTYLDVAQIEALHATVARHFDIDPRGNVVPLDADVAQAFVAQRRQFVDRPFALVACPEYPEKAVPP